MSYQRIRTPIIYADNINHLLTLGKMTSSDITQSGLSLASGSSLIEMFDMKPSNIQTLTADRLTQDHQIRINTNTSTDAYQNTNFVAILGHNFAQAGAEFRVSTDDASWTSATHPANTEVVNCGGGASASGTSFNTPTANGWSLCTFSQTSDNQNIRVYIRETGGTYLADIKIGCILFGTYYTFAHAPDMNISKTLSFNGVKTQQSIGGQTYANASYINASPWVIEPYSNSTNTSVDALRRSGRQKVDMNFSYMADSTLFPQQIDDKTYNTTGDSLMAMLMRTGGTLHPLLFQYDKNTADGDDSFLWCRFADTPRFSQVAHQTWSTDISLIEEF